MGIEVVLETPRHEEHKQDERTMSEVATTADKDSDGERESSAALIAGTALVAAIVGGIGYMMMRGRGDHGKL